MCARIFFQSIALLLYLIIQTSALFASQPSPVKDDAISPEIKERVESLVQKSAFYLKKNYDSSVYYAAQAKTLSEKHHDSIGQAVALLAIGKANIHRNQFSKASDYFYQSLDFLSTHESDSLEAELFMRLGIINFYHDSYYSAADYLFQSLFIAEERNYDILLLELNLWISRLFETIQNSDGASQYYEKAVEAGKKVDDLDEYSVEMIGLANLFGTMLENDKSEEDLIRDLEIYSSDDSRTQKAIILIELGNIRFNQADYRAAHNYYAESMEVLEKVDSSSMVLADYFTAIAMVQLGKNYCLTGNYNSSIDQLTKAIQIARSKNHFRVAVEGYRQLSIVYEKKDDLVSALQYYKSYYTLKDSIMNAFNISEITRIGLGYIHDREMKEKKLKRLQDELKYRKTTQKYRLMLLGGGMLTVIIILVFLIYRSKQRIKAEQQKLHQHKLENEKASLQNEIDVKNRELTTTVIYLLKKNNFLHNFKEELQAAINQNKHSNIKGYRDLLKNLNASISKDAWEEFETRFNSVHQSFNESLLKDFPDLTPNELKLCAFLKLNMTTKDIETITYQSNNTIGVARHRLRAKLNIERDENLVTFLAKY